MYNQWNKQARMQESRRCIKGTSHELSTHGQVECPHMRAVESPELDGLLLHELIIVIPDKGAGGVERHRVVPLLPERDNEIDNVSVAILWSATWL